MARSRKRWHFRSSDSGVRFCNGPKRGADECILRGQHRPQVKHDAVVNDASNDRRIGGPQTRGEFVGAEAFYCDRYETGWQPRGRRGASADDGFAVDYIDCEMGCRETAGDGACTLADGIL